MAKISRFAVLASTVYFGVIYGEGAEPEFDQEKDKELIGELQQRGIIGDKPLPPAPILEAVEEESAAQTLDVATIEANVIDSLNESLEDIAAQISGRLGIARVSDESAFVFIKRFADEEVPLIAEQLRADADSGTPSTDPFEPLNANAAKALRGAGIETGAQVKATGDETLLAINGIADASVKQLRELFGVYESAE